MNGAEKLALAATARTTLHKQAQLLTKEGQQQLNFGQPQEALKTWEEATKLYLKLNYQEGITGSLINQSIALEDLGLNLRACSTLLEALKLDANGWLCNSSLFHQPDDFLKALELAIEPRLQSAINLLGLQNLGDVLRLIGRLSESKLVLQKAIALNPESLTDILMLSLGNTERAIFNQLKDKYADIGALGQRKDPIKLIQAKISDSFQLYYQLSETSHSQIIRLRAQLKYLAELIDVEKWSMSQIKLGEEDLTSYHAQIQTQIQPLVAQIQESSSVFSQLSPVESVLAKLNFATSLSQMTGRQWQLLALQYTDSALQTAQGLRSPRLKSNSFGVLGKLAIKFADKDKSRAYFEEAVHLAQEAQVWDLAWQWQFDLGQIYQQQGNKNQAIQAYSSALDNLNLVRSNLLAIAPDTQYSFRDRVEPLYRELIRLLLSVSNPDLDRVVDVNEQLQLAELEDFLRCGKLDLISLNRLQHLTNQPTIIHVIDLNDSVAVIVQAKDGSLHLHIPDSELVKNNIFSLTSVFQNQKFIYIGSNKKYINTEVSDLLPFSQELYHQLISPIKSYLPSSGTLIFVLDSSFQNLPMGILHDGQQFLLEKYSIALTLNSQLRQPKALQKKQLRALVGGLSTNSPSSNNPIVPKGLAPLPATLTEIKEIQQTISTLVLLNQQFTTERLQKEISQSDFPIIHISTHGKFSSDPGQTFILDWDQALDIQQLNGLLTTGNQQHTIELLVLSACQTAEGDKRSALGIAGVAAQAGARSTVASLWLVDADSTALLMRQFYQGLKSGLSKAEALRQAQLFLLSNPKYSNPFYWSSFVLVGSWL